MNSYEKNEIVKLQAQGLGYKKIADILELPVNTVKSFCYRYPSSKQDNVCEQCGKEITQTPHRKKKRFCSDKCRMMWWNSHPEKVKRKAIYTFTCQYCGKTFHSYGKQNQKFCSRDCYAKFRSKGNTNEQ